MIWGVQVFSNRRIFHDVDGADRLHVRLRLLFRGRGVLFITTREYKRKHYRDEQEVESIPFLPTAHHEPAFRVMHHDDAGHEDAGGDDGGWLQPAVGQKQMAAACDSLMAQAR